MGHVTAFPLRVASLLLAVALVTTTATPATEQSVCVAGKQVALSLRLHTNATGHQQVNTHLEQPARISSWQLDFELGTPGCITGQEELRAVTLSLTGSPPVPQVPLVPPVPQMLQLPTGYFPVTGFGFIRPAKHFVEWEVANATCTAEGATLVMPTSLEQANALTAILNYDFPGHWQLDWAWLGATDYAEEGTWISVKGDPVAQMKHTWHPLEPNGGNSENCLVVLRSDGRLGSAPCNWKLTYACQLKL